MTTEEKNDIERLYNENEETFTCTFCKLTVYPKDCEGCPIYGWAFCPDD